MAFDNGVCVVTDDIDSQDSTLGRQQQIEALFYEGSTTSPSVQRLWS